jgi:hypothetical protein
LTASISRPHLIGYPKQEPSRKIRRRYCGLRRERGEPDLDRLEAHFNRSELNIAHIEAKLAGIHVIFERAHTPRQTADKGLS